MKRLGAQISCKRSEALQPAIWKLAELPVPDADVIAIAKKCRAKKRRDRRHLVRIRMKHVDWPIRIKAAKMGFPAIDDFGAIDKEGPESSGFCRAVAEASGLSDTRRVQPRIQ